MKSTIRSYIVIGLIVIFELLNILVLDTKTSASVNQIIINVFWILLCFLSILLFKYPKGSSMHKKTINKIIVSSLLSIILITYLLGFFVGFSKNAFSYRLWPIIRTVFPIILAIVSKEIIRCVFAKNSKQTKKPIIFLTIIFIIAEVINTYLVSNVVGFEGYFIFSCKVVMTTIAKEILLSYLSYNFGLSPTLIYNIPLSIYPYVLPLVPNLGDFIYSVIFLLLPFLLYLSTIKIVEYQNKVKFKVNAKTESMFFIPVLLILIVMVSLVTGIFGYKMVAIISGSMQPSFDRGDAVIYKKIKSDDEFVVGEVIAYQKDKIIIAHRIVEIKEKNGVIEIHTKGDNNEGEDSYIVKKGEVLGKVLYVVKYIGYPTVLLSEAF